MPYRIAKGGSVYKVKKRSKQKGKGRHKKTFKSKTSAKRYAKKH